MVIHLIDYIKTYFTNITWHIIKQERVVLLYITGNRGKCILKVSGKFHVRSTTCTCIYRNCQSKNKQLVIYNSYLYQTYMQAWKENRKAQSNVHEVCAEPNMSTYYIYGWFISEQATVHIISFDALLDPGIIFKMLEKNVYISRKIEKKCMFNQRSKHIACIICRICGVR